MFYFDVTFDCCFGGKLLCLTQTEKKGNQVITVRPLPEDSVTLNSLETQ